MDHLGIEKAVWIGEATGGVLGTFLAATVPERFHCVIVMSCAPRVADDAFDSQDPQYLAKVGPGEAVVGADMLSLLQTKGLWSWAHISARTRPRFWDAPTEQVDWYVEQLATSDPLLAAEFYRPMPEVDVLPLVSKIKIPMLYIDGTHHPMMPPDQLAELSKNPNITVATVDGPGIDIQYARPAACVATVLDYLKNLDLLDNDLA
jgi:pimeloyl-ACP methyl ester carboxylesterase